MMLDASPSSLPGQTEHIAPSRSSYPPPPPSFATELPIAEMVLLAMTELLEADIAQLSATKEEIAVQAFKSFPETFAMQKFRTLLDSNKVYVQLAKGKPLQKNGWIQPSADSNTISSYQLTRDGLKAAQRIKSRVMTADRKRARGPKLTMEEHTELMQLFNNPAFLKRLHGKMIDRQDARQFWGITPRHLARNRFLRVDELLRKAQTQQIIDYHRLDQVRLVLVVQFHEYLIQNYSQTCA